MRLGIPDLVSPSYFPAAVMVEGGFAEAEGLDLEITQLWPVGLAVDELHADRLDLLAAPPHVVPRQGSGTWGRPRILAALSQGTFWFLVAAPELGVDARDLSTLAGVPIAAAPGPDRALRLLLRDAGVDAEALGITIGLPPEVPRSRDLSFGAWAARALRDRSITAFWANGMGAEVAVRAGAGEVVLDVRRGDGPGAAFDYTFPALMVSGAIAEGPVRVRAAVYRALQATHRALREDPSIAQGAADRLFPPEEAALIVELLRRDSAFYDAEVSFHAIRGLSRLVAEFDDSLGVLAHEDVVATH